MECPSQHWTTGWWQGDNDGDDCSNIGPGKEEEESIWNEAAALLLSIKDSKKTAGWCLLVCCLLLSKRHLPPLHQKTGQTTASTTSKSKATFTGIQLGTYSNFAGRQKNGTESQKKKPKTKEGISSVSKWWPNQLYFFFFYFWGVNCNVRFFLHFLFRFTTTT